MTTTVFGELSVGDRFTCPAEGIFYEKIGPCLAEIIFEKPEDNMRTEVMFAVHHPVVVPSVFPLFVQKAKAQQ